MSYSLRILCDAHLPDKVIRLWDGSGRAFVDGDGNLYRAAQFSDEALQQIEASINGTAFTMSLHLVGLPQMVGDEIWEYDESTPVNGSLFVVKIQEVDEFSQPLGEPEIKFTGTIDNLQFGDQADEDNINSSVTIEVVNSFTLRTNVHGGVLSDVDQKARSALLNPSAPADRFCERIPGLRDKTIRWPSWS